MPYNSEANLTALINAVIFDEPDRVNAIVKEHETNIFAEQNNIELTHISENLNLESLLKDIDHTSSTKLEKLRWVFLEGAENADFVKEYIQTPWRWERLKFPAAVLTGVGLSGYLVHETLPEMYNVGVGLVMAAAVFAYEHIIKYTVQFYNWAVDRLNQLHVEAIKDFLRKSSRTLNELISPYDPKNKDKGDKLVRMLKQVSSSMKLKDYLRGLVGLVEYTGKVNKAVENFLDEKVEKETGIRGIDIVDMFLNTDTEKFPDIKEITKDLIPLGYKKVYSLLQKIKNNRFDPKKSPVEKEILEKFAEYIRSQVIYTKIDIGSIVEEIPSLERRILRNVKQGGPFTIVGANLGNHSLTSLGEGSEFPPIIRRKGDVSGKYILEKAENGLVYFKDGIDSGSTGTLRKATGGTYIFHGSIGKGVAEYANDTKNPLVMICIDEDNELESTKPPIRPSAEGGIFALIQRQDNFRFYIAIYKIIPDKGKNAAASYDNIKKQLEVVVNDKPDALKIVENYTRQYIQDWHNSRKTT